MTAFPSCIDHCSRDAVCCFKWFNRSVIQACLCKSSFVVVMQPHSIFKLSQPASCLASGLIPGAVQMNFEKSFHLYCVWWRKQQAPEVVERGPVLTQTLAIFLQISFWLQSNTMPGPAGHWPCSLCQCEWLGAGDQPAEPSQGAYKIELPSVLTVCIELPLISNHTKIAKDNCLTSKGDYWSYNFFV